MATVTGLTAARMAEIEDASIIEGAVNGLGNLILTTKGGTDIDAGSVNPLQATEDVLGSVMLADNSEVLAGTSTDRVVTPAGLKAQQDSLTGYKYLQKVLFTSSGSFTKASYAGLKAVRVITIGGGGGGGGAPTASTGNHSAGGGGGGGGYAEKFILAADLAATETVTVGAGGAAGTPSVVAGAGGTTSFGTHAVATGGDLGQAFGNNALMLAAHGGAGGIGTSGTVLARGGPGTFGSGHGTLAHSGIGGNSALGGGGVGVYTPSGSGASTGTPGGAYGGGGGGAAVNASGTGVNGGAGAPGIVIVEVYV